MSRNQWISFTSCLMVTKRRPRAKLLEFMKASADFEDLDKLPVEELRLIYAERLTYSAMAQKSN